MNQQEEGIVVGGPVDETITDGRFDLGPAFMLSEEQSEVEPSDESAPAAA